MKPRCQFQKRQFPQTDYFFHRGHGEWRGYSSRYDGDEGRRFRSSHNLGREYLIESARERAKEMVAFGVVVVASAWPVIYMVVSVIKLLLRGRPIDH